ncbi:MAG: NlpC/P60 family protein [Rhizobiaceae bacterium]
MHQQTPPDKRLNVYRDDLADSALQGVVSAEQYVDGQLARVAAHFADVYDKPNDGAGLQTQFLHGHDVTVFDRNGGWAWVQGQTDGYVGYVRSELLVELDATTAIEPTHMVTAPRTFLYSESDLKSPRSGYRSIGSKLTVVDKATTRGTDYAILDNGEAIIANHLTAIGDWLSDPTTVAETLLHTPYLWGGGSGFGIDCSGLVSIAHLLCGQIVLRDSDMQAASIGEVIPLDIDQLERGDLIFWNGHVGLMADSRNLLHANGNTMNVALEPLADAIKRIGYLYDAPTLARRP